MTEVIRSGPAAWPRPIRVALAAVGIVIGLVCVVFAAAWVLMPRDFIQTEARRMVARTSNAQIRWTKLAPSYQQWALGVTVENLELRMPETGPARIQARLPEAFVRFRLFPLLFRRVEVDGARVRGGGIVLTDQAPTPSTPGESKASRNPDIYLPRVELDGVSIRTRDPLGTGYDLKRVSGSAEFDGTLDRPRAIRVDATADSLYWKTEARSPLLAMPSPLKVKLSLDSKEGGRRLVVTEGRAELGPLISSITGEIRLPPAPAPAQIALRAAGGPQTVRSSDPSLRSLTAGSPASFSASVSWDVRFGGTPRDMTHQGRLTLKPLSVSAESNTFAIDQASVSWSSLADQTFVGRAEGFGGGVTFTVEARGATRPGGEIRGTFYGRAPAERLNGLAVNGPRWNTGDVECRGSFVSHPPAAVSLEYTLTGTGMSGTMPGLARPIRRLTFSVTGDRTTANVKSLEAVVGSSTANMTGQVKMGAIRSGTFDVQVNRLVAEEWTLGSSDLGGGLETGSGPGAKSQAPLPVIVATVHVGELRNRGLVARDVTAPVRFADGKLVADPIRGTIGGGSVQGALDISGIGARPSFTLHLDLKQVPVEDMVAGLLPVRLPVTGVLNEAINLTGTGFPGPQAASSMKGTVAGVLERGSLMQTPALKQIRESLGAEAPSDIPFQAITHAARIDQGKLLLDKVTGDLGKDLFSLAGALGFDQSLDLNALLRLAPSRAAGGGLLAQLARYARDADGRIPVEVKITGTALAPKVSVRPGRLIQAATTEILKEGLTRILGGGGGGQRGDSASALADSTAARRGTRGGGLLEQLFGQKPRKTPPKPPATPPAATPPPATPPPDSARATHSAAPRDSTAKRDSVANPIQKALDRLLGK
ncbi:MAG TPA: AsmA-like C-terminal region-containing protein [Candidatus Limnocylindrales bacterium]|nr:AsmA-like C-terminal region-containing protein [Candidatus Limnocylindrales bacterium]